MIRQTSYHSLIEIPTYGSNNVRLQDYSSSTSFNGTQGESGNPRGLSLVETLAVYQPILDEKVQRHNQMMEERVMCVATMLVLCCLMLVGTMLAVTSGYQDKLVADMINSSNHIVFTMDEESTYSKNAHTNNENPRDSHET